MDPDLLGGNSCILLQLLEEMPRGHSKAVLERIENWTIPKPRVEVLSCSLLKKNLDIEVLKKTQALVPAVRETLESNIVKWRAEADKWKIELLKFIVLKMMRDSEILEGPAQEMEALRRKAQDCGQKNMDIEAARMEAAAEHESRVASSLAAMTERAKDDELRIESLQTQLAEKCKELAEKSMSTEFLKMRVKATASRVASSIKGMTKKAEDDELRIQLLQNKVAHERAEEDSLLLFANEDLLMKEDLDFPAAKRKRKGGAYNFTTVKMAGDEEEAAKQQSEENGRKNFSTGIDRVNHVKWGVGANSGEEVCRRFDQIPLEQAPIPTPSASSASYAEQDSENPNDIVVPDSDFYDFDAVRTEKHILPGQIWAVYDDQDGMPRFYARVCWVTTKPSFKAYVNWLEHCPATEEERVWTGTTGFSITCGDFRVGKADVVNTINSFSHVVVDKVGRGLLKIYPQKGQVWAVYKDPEQGIVPAGGPRCRGEGRTPKYEMVEVLHKFRGKQGIRTGKLVKGMGLKTVFHRQYGMESFRLVKPEELVTFSHRVPNRRIPSCQTDAYGIPRGSLDLDPASTPMDLVVGPSDPSM